MVLQMSNSMSCRPSPTTPPAQKQKQKAEAEFRRGPWTVQEDLMLVDYITRHGVGRWNSVPHAAGLKRAGKSCRLRWVNYLRPDVKRGRQLHRTGAAPHPRTPLPVGEQEGPSKSFEMSEMNVSCISETSSPPTGQPNIEFTLGIRPSKSFEMSEMNVSCISETSSPPAEQPNLEFTLGRPQ